MDTNLNNTQTLPISRSADIHPSTAIDPNATIGKGTKIWQFTSVMKNAHIGNNCIIGQNVHVAQNVKVGNHVKIQNNVSLYEGVELEDYVFCGPSMVFTNIKVPRSKYPQAESKFYKRTLVKEGASIGANATIVCGLTLGRFSFIGAGAVVTKDVPDFAIIVGNPGRQTGWMSEAGTVLEFNDNNLAYCPKCTLWYDLNNNSVKESERN
jgi:UDP-2-acetamido-3-amino-2,3-dideoxy-glucuronate N-acetyltransferase